MSVLPMRRHRTDVLHLLLLVAATFGCSDGPKPDAGTPATTISVRFPIPIVEAGQTPFYVAEDLGYYKAENLEVSFEMGSKELNPVKTVAVGTDTFGVLGGPDTLLVARSQGQPLRAIAVLHRNSNFPCLLTLKESGITTVEQLEGKKVGFFYGHISTDVLRNFFRRAGVSVEEVDVGFDYSQLIATRIAAQWAFTVTAGIDLPAKGIDVNIISPTSHGIVTHGYTIFATEATLSAQPQAVQRFLRATLRGVYYTLAHPEEANALLVKRDDSIDVPTSLRRLKAYNAVTSSGADVGHMDRDMFQSTYERLREEGVIKHELNVDDAFTTTFLDGARSTSSGN